MAVDTFQQSIWPAITPPPVSTTPLEGSTAADVALIGAGFLGLVTALRLAEAGVSVAVLEADEPGYGASGRNTGFVVPSLKSHIRPPDLAQIIGAERADRLFRLVGRSGSIVFDLCDRLGLKCDAERTGWLQPAHTADAARAIERSRDDWRALGREVEILSREETARAVGADGYHAAMLDRTGGQINPLAYARELARVLLERGGRLHGRSPVTGLDRREGRWRVATARGEVVADRVILTTNALVGGLVPTVDNSIIPVRVHQIATQRLSAEAQAEVLPDRSSCADTRRHTFAVRWSPDGRLITGGLVLPGPGELARAARFFTRRLERFFPRLGPIRAEHAWFGTIALTADSLPRLLSVAPGLDAAFACNGRGVALTTALGSDIASLVAGRTSEAEFVLPRLAPVPVPGRRFAPLARPLWLPWNSLRDRLETGRA